MFVHDLLVNATCFECCSRGSCCGRYVGVCGRITLRTLEGRKLDWVATRVGTLIVPRYNIAPSQDVLTVMPDGERRELMSIRWGLIPWWSKEAKGIINARVETIDEKPSFKESFERRRCLILADGFYEWERVGKKISQPYYFQMNDQAMFAFAGIWDRWRQNDEIIITCAIITTVANELLAEIHTRMPVILRSESYDEWLDDNSQPEDLKRLLVPFSADQMKSHAVAYDVNDPKIEQERLIEPATPNIGVTLPLFQ